MHPPEVAGLATVATPESPGFQFSPLATPDAPDAPDATRISMECKEKRRVVGSVGSVPSDFQPSSNMAPAYFGIASVMTSEAADVASCNDSVDKCA